MRIYFIHDGTDEKGPFNIDELRSQPLKKETPIWYDGLGEWSTAGKIEELKEFFISTPPPFSTYSTSFESDKKSFKESITSAPERKGVWIGRNPKISILILVLIVAVSVSFYNIQASKNYDPYTSEIEVEKTPDELRAELLQKENENPKEYLKANITMRENLLGEKVFEGTITNNATLASFKDVVVEISFLSKTESMLGTEKFTVYEKFPPRGSVSITKHKTFAPKQTEKCTYAIVAL